MRTLTCKELDLSYDEVVDLRNAGKLNLGMDNGFAAQISNDPNMGPAQKGVSIAFHLWSWIAVGVLGYTIYLSFVSDWWWFILGFIGMSIIWKANKRGNSENLLDAAFEDRDFYDRVKTAGGWLYQVDESVIKSRNVE